VFFNETINWERYVQVILWQFFSELTDEKDSIAGFSKTQLLPTLQALSDDFGDRIISSGIWSARSSELNSCDFFFWSCLKSKVYNSNPRKKEELKQIFRRKLQIFLLNSFKGQIGTSFAGARNVYVYRESIFNTSCDL
jgi:hypothetical protein